MTRTKPLLLALAALAGIGGIVQNDASLRFILVGLAALLVTGYFVTRSAMLTISSAGESIAVPAKGLGHDAIVEFIGAVDDAKLRLVAPERRAHSGVQGV